MITYIPFVYFIILTYVLFRKRGLDVSVFISLLYVITSFCSILMFKMGLVERNYSHPSLIATIVYCGLLTFCIVPISKLKLCETDLIVTPKTERILTRLTYVFFVVFLIYIILNIQDIIYVLLFGDYAQLRYDILNENIGHVQGVSGYLSILLNLFASISFIMVLVFFISITYLKKGVLFNLCALCGSLTSLLSEILGISRAGIFYYAIILSLCLVIFWKKIGFKTKLSITIPISALVISMGIYFSQVTTDRFEENYAAGGTQGGLISYTGMPYSNFCYFFDNKPYTGVSTRFLLPFTNYVLKGYKGGTERELEMTRITNMSCVSFMTFLGSFIMDCNQVMPFIFVILYTLLLRHCLRNKHGTRIKLFWLIFIFILIIVPSIGCISYFYTSPFRNLSLAVLLIFLKINKV